MTTTLHSLHAASFRCPVPLGGGYVHPHSTLGNGPGPRELSQRALCRTPHHGRIRAALLPLGQAPLAANKHGHNVTAHLCPQGTHNQADPGLAHSTLSSLGGPPYGVVGAHRVPPHLHVTPVHVFPLPPTPTAHQALATYWMYFLMI
jgi:hypothetical protein